MKPLADQTSDERRDEGWDETVLVWNATVARVPAPTEAAGRHESGPPLSEDLPVSRPRGRKARRPSCAGPGRT
jgi:hypothetical protein